jgi:hypothetical protein
MYVIVEKIILYYIWNILIIKNYYFKLFKKKGFCETQIISQRLHGLKVWEPLAKVIKLIKCRDEKISYHTTNDGLMNVKRRSII